MHVIVWLCLPLLLYIVRNDDNKDYQSPLYDVINTTTATAIHPLHHNRFIKVKRMDLFRHSYIYLYLYTWRLYILVIAKTCVDTLVSFNLFFIIWV